MKHIRKVGIVRVKTKEQLTALGFKESKYCKGLTNGKDLIEEHGLNYLGKNMVAYYDPEEKLYDLFPIGCKVYSRENRQAIYLVSSDVFTTQKVKL